MYIYNVHVHEGVLYMCMYKINVHYLHIRHVMRGEIVAGGGRGRQVFSPPLPLNGTLLTYQWHHNVIVIVVLLYMFMHISVNST